MFEDGLDEMDDNLVPEGKSNDGSFGSFCLGLMVAFAFTNTFNSARNESIEGQKSVISVGNAPNKGLNSATIRAYIQTRQP